MLVLQKDSMGLVSCTAGSTALHLAGMRGDERMCQLIINTYCQVGGSGLISRG